MKTFDNTIALSLLDSENEFPVDFDLAWQWIGYSRKDKAKEFLIKNLLSDIDYVLHLQEELRTLDVPRPASKIYLTVEAFKMWAMMAKTETGRQVRTYFLQCEKIAKQKSSQLQLNSYDDTRQRLKNIALAFNHCCYHLGFPPQNVHDAITIAIDGYTAKTRIEALPTVKGSGHVGLNHISNESNLELIYRVKQKFVNLKRPKGNLFETYKQRVSRALASAI